MATEFLLISALLTFKMSVVTDAGSIVGLTQLGNAVVIWFEMVVMLLHLELFSI